MWTIILCILSLKIICFHAMHDIKFQLIEGGEKMIDEFWNGMNKKLEITFPEIDFQYKKKTIYHIKK